MLVPSDRQPALIVAWTLVHEMLFYAIFALIFLGRPVFYAAVAAWTVAMLIGNGNVQSPWLVTLLHPINLEFILGMTCAVAYRSLSTLREAARVGYCALAAGAIVTVLYLAFEHDLHRSVFGLAAALIVLGAVLLERRVRRKIPRPLVKLGDASYAIYLVHTPSLSLTSRIAPRFPVIDHWIGALAFSTVCFLAVGWLYYRLFERPALLAFRKHVLSRWGPR